MIVRLSFEVSTHVTKSSICLSIIKMSRMSRICKRNEIPCHKKCRICDSVWSNSYMPLLDEFYGLHNVIVLVEYSKTKFVRHLLR